MAEDAPLLAVEGLSVEFSGRAGTARVLNGVDLTVRGGETLGIVGESGCGKSMTALSILRLVPSPPGRIAAGRVVFEGTDLLAASEERVRDIRGNRIAMIFQEPMTSLNPVFTVGNQIGEGLRRHLSLGTDAARARSIELLTAVGIPAPEQRVDEYPHQLSGGMRQRVMIAMAIACEPALLIADEPTTALDVTVQAQIMELLQTLRVEKNLALVLITHDLGVVAGSADRVAVMYAGRIVERAPVRDLFADPQHPYSRALLECLPRLDQKQEVVSSIGGTPPNPADLPTGCPFAPRCPMALPSCTQAEPTLVRFRTSEVACNIVSGGDRAKAQA